MNVEDVANQSSVIFDTRYKHDKKTQFHGFIFVSPGSAETIVMRGGIINRHLIAYFFSNISAQNYQNRLMCVEVIVCNINVVFETQRRPRGEGTRPL